MRRRLRRFLALREDGDSLALVRLGAGLALVWNVASAFVAGVAPVAWVDAAHGGYRPLVPDPRLAALGGAHPTVVAIVGLAALVCGGLLAAGLWPRAAALVGGQALLALTRTNPHAQGSYDALLAGILFLLAIGDPGAALSPFARRRKVLRYPRALLAIQLAAVYGGTALHKVSAAWTPAGRYAALYYILQQPSWHRFDLSAAAHVFWATQLATAMAWWFELSFPVLVAILLARGMGPAPKLRLGRLTVDLRTPWVAFGVTMHLLILALLEVGPFSLIILSLYPALYTPREIRAALGRLGATVGRLRTAVPRPA